jgi:hypothetical protein
MSLTVASCDELPRERQRLINRIEARALIGKRTVEWLRIAASRFQPVPIIRLVGASDEIYLKPFLLRGLTDEQLAAK